MRNIAKRRLRRPPIVNPDGTITLQLTKGKFSEIDADYADLGQYNWQANFLFSYAHGGAYTASRHEFVTQRRILLHREIMERFLGRPLDSNEEVDHIDCNPLNNRLKNLRLTNRSGNTRNTQKSKRNSSGVKGVSWHRGAEKWQVHIMVDRKNMYLGLFSDLAEAKSVIEKARAKFHGTFGRQS